MWTKRVVLCGHICDVSIIEEARSTEVVQIGKKKDSLVWTKYGKEPKVLVAPNLRMEMKLKVKEKVEVTSDRVELRGRRSL